MRNSWEKDVQENIKVGDRIKEVEPILTKILKQKAKEYKGDVNKVKAELDNAKLAYENSTNTVNKVQLKIAYDKLVIKYNEMKAKYNKLTKGVDPEGWTGKLSSFKTQYDKTLK